MKVLQEIDKKTSYRKIAEQFDLAISTVSKIAKDRERTETEASNQTWTVLKFRSYRF